MQLLDGIRLHRVQVENGIITISRACEKLIRFIISEEGLLLDTSPRRTAEYYGLAPEFVESLPQLFEAITVSPEDLLVNTIDFGVVLCAL